MTPPAAATPTHGLRPRVPGRAAATHPARPRPRRATSAPRRVSGPAGGRRAVTTAPRPVALRLAAAVHTVAEHRWLDRVVRGRAWIAILGVGLIGIVFMQVSMLRLNAGIGRAIEQSSTLERQNAALQASVSQLSSGERIASAAGKLGFVLPPGGSTRFLDARDTNLRKAIGGIERPGSRPLQQLEPAPSTALGISQTGVAVGEPETGTATTGDQAAATTPAAGTTTPTTTAPTTTNTTTPAAGTQPATATQPTTQQQAPAPTATPANQAAVSGGTTAGQGG